MEERTMDVIEKFGNRVSSQALKDPEKARRLLLAGYRLQEKKLQFLPDRELPSSGQYVARVVMKNIILFDVNQQHFDLLPLAFTRPVSDIRIGILTIREKWEHRLPGMYSSHTRIYGSQISGGSLGR